MEARKEAKDIEDNLKKLGNPLDDSHAKKLNECTICLEPFTKESRVTTLPCDERHFFHDDCIVRWAQKRCYRCPLCNVPFTLNDLKDHLTKQSARTMKRAGSLCSPKLGMMDEGEDTSRNQNSSRHLFLLRDREARCSRVVPAIQPLSTLGAQEEEQKETEDN